MLSTGTSFSGWMQAEQLTWHYDGKTIELGADWSGQGPLVLLFALSSISTRREMRDRDAPRFWALEIHGDAY